MFGWEVMMKTIKEINQILLKNRDLIKEAIGCAPLFGAVIGPSAFNLANKYSDIDVYLIGDAEPKEAFVIMQMEDLGQTDIHIMPISISISVCNEYIKKIHNYPSILYRDPRETQKIALCKYSERPDWQREFVIYIYMSDAIIDFAEKSSCKYYEELKNGLRLIDVWDSFYNRAYGNYHEKIKDQEKVLLRKYLHTISEIRICYDLLFDIQKPIIDYRSMFSSANCLYADSEIIRICDKLWQENRFGNLPKEKLYISADEKLNHWIESMLATLLKRMRKEEEYLQNNYLPYEFGH